MSKRLKITTMRQETVAVDMEEGIGGAAAVPPLLPDLPNDCWQRILNLFTCGQLQPLSRMALVDRTWRVRTWMLAELIEVPFKTASRLVTLLPEARLFPSNVSFTNLKKLVTKRQFDVVVILTNSPRLEKANLVVSDWADVALASHPTLTHLQIEARGLSILGFPLSSIVPRNLTHLRLSQPVFKAGFSLRGLAQATPNLLLFESSFGFDDEEAKYLKELSKLQTLRIRQDFPGMNQLVFGSFSEKMDRVMSGRKVVIELEPLVAWVRENLPPVELRRLHIGTLGRLFMGPTSSSVALSEAALKQGFVPSLQELMAAVSRWGQSFDARNIPLHVRWLIDHYDLTTLPFPPTETQNPFAAALQSALGLGNLADDSDFTLSLFDKLLLPYIKHWTPLLMANSPRVSQTAVEAYIGTRALLEGCGVNFLFLDHPKSIVFGRILDALRFPLDVNFVHRGTPLCQMLPPRALCKLADRAAAQGTPLDVRALNSDRESLYQLLQRNRTQERYEAMHWAALEVVARFDPADFLSRPFEFLDRLRSPRQSKENREARERLYRQLLENLSDTSLTAMEVARHMADDKEIPATLGAILAPFIKTDEDRIECVRRFIFEAKVPQEAAAEAFLDSIERPTHLVEGSLTLLHLIRCQHKGWDRLLLPDDLRTQNKGLTPLHHWLAEGSKEDFWKFALRHNATVEDFSATNSKGMKLIGVCRAHTIEHQRALQRVVDERKDLPDGQRQLVAQYLQLLSNRTRVELHF